METESNSEFVEDATTTSSPDEDRALPPAGLSSAISPEIIHFDIQSLKNHPLSDAIYGTEVSDELLESINTLGILQPILVVKDSLEIISGNSRVKAARNLGYQRIQGTYFGSINDLEIQQAVLESNSQRVKTNEQKVREYNARKTIESELTILRKSAANPDEKQSKAIAREAKGKAREKAAKKSGVSANVAQKASKVIEKADRLKEEGKVEESTELLNVLNKSINAAHKLVVQQDAPADAEPTKPKNIVAPIVPQAVLGSPGREFSSQQEAVDAAQAIVRFLRSLDASDFDTEHREIWNQVAADISGRLRELRISDEVPA
jgi:ParB-like chromosome segregation protein Spo0J